MRLPRRRQFVSANRPSRSNSVVACGHADSTNKNPSREGGVTERFAAASRYSSGSTFTILWSWLLPTQKLTGVVVLST